MKKILFCLISTALLAGCDNELEDMYNKSVQAEVKKQLTMQDLVIPDNFKFNPVVVRNLDVDAQALTEEQAYISIYGEFVALDDGTYQAKSDSRILAGVIDKDINPITYVTTQSKQVVLAEVWFDSDKEPLQYVVIKGQESLIL